MPGELATEREKCKSCSGGGTLNGRQGPEQCVNCHGKGWYLIDGYTRKRTVDKPETGPLSGPDRAQWRRTLDTQIDRTKAQLHRPPEVHSAADLADVQPEKWERDRDRYYRAGSYRNLDLALEWLASRAPQARSLIGWVYESGAADLAVLDDSIGAASTLAVNILADQMPDPVKVPHWLTSAPRRGNWAKAA